jgi:predicted nucleic acid-binding protein
VIVADASVIAPALADDGGDGERARSHLIDQRLAAPELLDLEVASVWRRAARAGRLEGRRARQALGDLAALTPYDAAYVALAEALNAPLLTADRRVYKAPGSRCEILLVR